MIPWRYYPVPSVSAALIPPPVFTLYDAFVTNRAAGAVNGTTSESPFPTGGGVARAAVDTNSKITISGGQLSFATGTAANDSVWWASQVRASKLALYAQVDTTGANTANGQACIGWDSNQTGAHLEELRLLGGPTVAILRNGTGLTLTGDTWAVNTAYQYLTILRAAGMLYFIKGGIYPYWTLLWTDTAGTTPTLYPAAGVIGTSPTFKVDNVRTLLLAAMPAPQAYDTFTRGNGALGTSETTGADSQTVTARTWTQQAGTWGVATNAAACSALAGGIGIATYPVDSVDVLHSANLTRSAGDVGIVVRYRDSSNYVIGYHDGTNAKLDKVVGGSTTNVISGVAAFSASAPICVICVGTSFRLYYNNAVVGTAQTIGDAALQTGAVCGLYTTNTGNTMDVAQTWARGTANEYSALDLA